MSKIIDKTIALAGLGNGIIDIIANVEESFLIENNLKKGSMLLVNEQEQNNLISSLSNDYLQFVCGGSVGNSIVTFSDLGLSTAWMTCVGDDDFSNMYIDEIGNNNITLNENSRYPNSKIGTCLVMITPDSERTMRTCLNVSSKIAAEHIDEEIIKKSKWCFLEGYLLANPEYGQSAILKSIEYAKKYNTKLALTLSDAFVVNCFREFIDSIINSVDLIFANEVEAIAYTGEKTAELASKALGKIVPVAVVTASEKGSFITQSNETVHMPVVTCNPIDMTGAGDTYAAGFLYGQIMGFNLEKSAKIATKLAGEVITIIGARLSKGKAAEIVATI